MRRWPEALMLWASRSTWSVTGCNGKADTVATIVSRNQPLAGSTPALREGAESTVRQYSLARILGVWAAATVPMSVLAWVVAPWLSDRIGGAEPLARSLLILLTLGLVWQFVLVVVLTWRELGTLRWSRVREALWLRAPQDPRTGRSGGRVWWWVLPFIVLLALWQMAPGLTGPMPRDMGAFLETTQGKDFFSGAWGWYALVVVMGIFNTILGEELLFRGLLLPRMHGVFGRWDWIANGLLFAAYHLHVPWAIPKVLADTLLYVYPSKRFRSAWMGIIVHSAQTVVISLMLLFIVFR
jgi:membrane protease YdiL (CAAX protease family)